MFSFCLLYRKNQLGCTLKDFLSTFIIVSSLDAIAFLVYLLKPNNGIVTISL